MTITNSTETRYVIHEAAEQLTALEFVDQPTAEGVLQAAEAVVNLLMVVFYQAETGRATKSDFVQATTALRHAMNAPKAIDGLL
ncbi:MULTISPECIES: type I toxin-antitoxin system ptaRNA1 family toxin [Burkholderia cepacia complex]|uniref:type I toxin-antitoxin system ptaRNA1 family toxin n=1 Tax=Burkholderia cepacia complex TaxID=87882 RepID=UPI00084163C2|nr:MULTISPECIES: type I toxin-antitoxin system ptaRNA1 family toxin [Burkholderia cepacia complex]AOJ14281.1 hypothetical protein WJ02_12235 [Burkholderia vietnamiensis]RQU01388.1 type I toxin-antitoxin system ptaRNA1 family toxin [Burkholderia cepacia]